MPFNASGEFERIYDWTDDRDAGVKILAERMDSEQDGIVEGLNAVVRGDRAFLGPIKTTYGTAAAPAYSFENDPDTGIYRSGSDQVTIATGGSPALRVYSDQRVNVFQELLVDDNEVFHEGNPSIAPFLRTNQANPIVRMGSDETDNFDGLIYDAGDDDFVFKADVVKTGLTVGNSRVHMGQVRATSTAPASASSTDHAAEFGDFAGGSGVKFDSTNLLARNDGEDKEVFYSAILQTTDVSEETFETGDAPNSWLIGENFKGDTNIATVAVSGSCYRVSNQAHITLELDFIGMSIDASSEGSLSGEIDIEAIAVANGWFTGIRDGRTGMAIGEFSGSGWDSPPISLNCNARNASGTIFFETGDTQNIPAQPSDATDFRLVINITLGVTG